MQTTKKEQKSKPETRPPLRGDVQEEDEHFVPDEHLGRMELVIADLKPAVIEKPREGSTSANDPPNLTHAYEVTLTVRVPEQAVPFLISASQKHRFFMSLLRPMAAPTEVKA